MAVPLKDLGRAIKRMQDRHHRTADARLASLGTTLVQWDALRHIAEHSDSSSHQLAQLTFQTDQSFGTLATRLVERGLIDRTPGPGRAIRHRLTAAGTKLLRTATTQVEAVLAESFAPLSSAERETLWALLGKLLAAG